MHLHPRNARGKIGVLAAAIMAVTAVFSLALAQPGNAAPHYILAVKDAGGTYWCVQSDPGGGGGVQLRLAACTGFAAQLWAPIRKINNTYFLENVGGNFGCLEAQANANFALVDTFTCTTESNEDWSPSLGFFPFRQSTLIAKVSGGSRCLDIQNGEIGAGGKVDIYNCLNDDLAQQFTMDTFANVIG